MTNINHKISPLGERGQAHLSSIELKMGVPTIYLGGDMDYYEDLIKNRPYALYHEEIAKFPSYAEYFETNIEGILSHETIHIAIFQQTKNIHVTRDFDNIDRHEEISGFVGYDS